MRTGTKLIGNLSGKENLGSLGDISKLFVDNLYEMSTSKPRSLIGFNKQWPLLQNMKRATGSLLPETLLRNRGIPLITSAAILPSSYLISNVWLHPKYQTFKIDLFSRNKFTGFEIRFFHPALRSRVTRKSIPQQQISAITSSWKYFFTSSQLGSISGIKSRSASSKKIAAFNSMD